MEASPFLRLPAELRVTIYHFALHHPEGIVIDIGGREPQPTRPSQSPEPNGTTPPPPPPPQPLSTALTATCSQIRHECSTIFYKLNTFHLMPMCTCARTRPSPVSEQRSKSIGPWLKSLGPDNRSALRHINIDIGTWSPPTTRAILPTKSLPPVPGQVAAYILCIRNLRLPRAKCTFTLEVQYSDIPDLGSFRLEEVDLRKEEQVFGTPSSVFERAVLAQAARVAQANVEGLVDSFGVVMLMMGLDRCRRGFAEFLGAVVDRVESEERWGGSNAVETARR